MARHDHHWDSAGEVEGRDVVRGTARPERRAFIRFLAGGDDWQQASRQLSGAFAEPPPSALPQDGRE